MIEMNSCCAEPLVPRACTRPTQRGISQLQALMHPVTLPENKKPDAAQRKPRECKPAGAYHAYQRWEREEKKKGKRLALATTVHGSRVCLFSGEREIIRSSRTF
jgi:hypothetical protein